jgi:hypothetical protein
MEAAMNEYNDPANPQNPIQPPPAEEVWQRDLAPKPRHGWLKKLLACNPFYLVSVALLLYGCYRVSLEPAIFNRETTHLIFNFASLQFYEGLLVGTAIFLSARRIWYDSTLLVALENMLLLVPFILISQAALIGLHQHSLVNICLAGGILASLRLGAMKHFVRELNFPTRACFLGFLFLAINVALPLVYRVLHENKVGTKPDWGMAYHTNQWMWLGLAPALCCLVSLLPRPNRSGTLWPQRHYLGLGFFTLWFLGTCTHLYCLGYVYDFSLSRELMAPVICAAAWIFRSQIRIYLPTIHTKYQPWFFVFPALVPLLAFTQEGSTVLLTLSVVNLLIYARMVALGHYRPFALNLALLSAGLLLADFPGNWLGHIFPALDRGKIVAAAAAACWLFLAMRSRTPSLGVLGGAVLGTWLGVGLGENNNAPHLAFQAGVLFLLLHSIRWEDGKHPGANAVRIMASALWAAHALFWAHDSTVLFWPIIAGGIPLVVCVTARLLRGRWPSFFIFVASLIVMMSGPLNLLAGQLQTISVGMLSLLGSLVLFAAGTLLALTRHHWHKTDAS